MTTTHFGYQSVDEADKARHVRGVFDSVAPNYDVMNDLMSAGLHRAWKAFTVLVADVHEGDAVLDIAGGTGDLAMAFAKKVGNSGQVVHTDINEAMLRTGRDRLLDAGVTLPTVVCDAEHLPFPDNHFAVVSVAFGLRNMTHKDAALTEMRRVLKPGGKLLFSEHGRSPDASVARWQTRLQPYWMPLAGGCHLDRDMPALLAQAGFASDFQRGYLWGPRVVSYHYWGEAVAA